MPPFSWTAQAIRGLAGLRIMVIGDLILDRYIWGRTERASPEAPVLVVDYVSEYSLLGGAGNVVSNLCAGGSLVMPCGVVGADLNGDEIRRMLQKRGAGVSGIFNDLSRPTIEKTRILSGNQQVLRIDRENRCEIREELRGQMLAWIEQHIEGCAGVVLSDYLKGTLCPELIERVTALCRRRGLMIVGDPKGHDYARYRGVDFITPNQKEAQAASHVSIEDAGSLRQAGRKLLSLTRGRGVVITRGHEDTAVFLRGGKSFLAPVHPREVYDVTGAGDTFISYFALALFGGYSPQAAAELGNLAGGLAVEKIGAVDITTEDLVNEIEGVQPARKLKSIAELEHICARLRNEGKRIVICQGSFDLLHAGHIRFLREARRRGDVLVVSMFSDRMIHQLKGKGRPFIDLAQRAEILSSLDPVDYIVECDEETPASNIQRLRPHVFATGANHPEAERLIDRTVNPYSGEIHLVPAYPGATKDQLIERVFQMRWGRKK